MCCTVFLMLCVPLTAETFVLPLSSIPCIYNYAICHHHGQPVLNERGKIDCSDLSCVICHPLKDCFSAESCDIQAMLFISLIFCLFFWPPLFVRVFFFSLSFVSMALTQCFVQQIAVAVAEVYWKAGVRK